MAIVMRKHEVQRDNSKSTVFKNTFSFKTQTELRSFLSVAGYYVQFIKGFASIYHLFMR